MKKKEEEHLKGQIDEDLYSVSGDLTNFSDGASNFSSIEKDLFASISKMDDTSSKKNDNTYFVATFTLGEEHMEDYSSLERDSIDQWKINEIENYNHLHSLRKRVKNTLKECMQNLYKLFDFKDSLFSHFHKPLDLNDLHELIVLSTNMYLSFTSLNDLICHMNRLMFIHNDGENYDFIPMRLLMRHYAGLEKVIGGYEEKLQFTLSQIGKLQPDLRSKKKTREKLELEHEKLLATNGSLERSISEMAKKLSEGFVTKGKDMIKEFKQKQEQSKKQMKAINKIVETEISGMGIQIEEFEKHISSILIHPDNHLNEKSQSTLYSMQIHVMHLSKRFQTLHKTITMLQVKLKKMMKKKISGTQNKVREIQERKGYNLKMKFARKHLEKLEKELLPQLKTLGDILNRDNVPRNEKKRASDLMKSNIRIIESVNAVVNQILTPIHPKISILKQLRALKRIPIDEDSNLGEELNQVMKTAKKKKKKKNKKNGKKSSSSVVRKNKKKTKKQTPRKNKNLLNGSTDDDGGEDEGYLPRTKHVKISSELYQKTKKMERMYEKKIREVKAKVSRYEMEEKRRKKKMAFMEMKRNKNRKKQHEIVISERPSTSSTTSSNLSISVDDLGVVLPDVEIKTVKMKTMELNDMRNRVDKINRRTNKKKQKKQNENNKEKQKKEDIEKKSKKVESQEQQEQEQPQQEQKKEQIDTFHTFLHMTREQQMRREKEPETKDIIDMEKDGWLEELVTTAGIENEKTDSVFDLEKYYAEDEAYDGDIATVEEEGEEGEYEEEGEEEEQQQQQQLQDGEERRGERYYDDDDGEEEEGEYSDEGEYSEEEEEEEEGEFFEIVDDGNAFFQQ